MKTQVSEFINHLGGVTRYSGKDKTIYIKTSRTKRGVKFTLAQFCGRVYVKFGKLPFKLA